MTQSSSTPFYQRKAEELRVLAQSEPNAVLREQHQRLAAIYQTLANHRASRQAARGGETRPTISIPQGMLRSA